jgi:hypothetical protein
MRDLIELVRIMAWPMTVIVILVILRREFRRFGRNIADRVRSAGSVSIGPRGLEFRGMIPVTPLPADVQGRKVELSRYIRSIRSKAQLDTIANVLDAAQSTDLRAQRNEIILQINRRVETKSDMDDLSAALKSATSRDF